VNVGAAIGDSIYFVSTALAGSSCVGRQCLFNYKGLLSTQMIKMQHLSFNTTAGNRWGDWIDYLIRFQNTGNDTAINVVVTDTLDTKLEPSSFEMIGSSHPPISQRKGRNLSFEFYNIMLPDSNVNDTGESRAT
jgi:uncharacterized repeat protein (TIGR01451 family)